MCVVPNTRYCVLIVIFYEHDSAWLNHGLRELLGAKGCYTLLRHKVISLMQRRGTNSNAGKISCRTFQERHNFERHDAF